MKKLGLVLALVFTVGVAQATEMEELRELQRKFDILAEEIESFKMNKVQNNVNFGGYGEYVYTDKEGKLEDGSLASHSSDPSWDAQRWILYVGYDFSDKWKLFTEVEIEHANEIYLEQAYLSYTHSKYFQFNIGVLLIPMGNTNLYHEPTAFLPTQRSDIEKKIIPTTWRENGISITGEYNLFRYNVGVYNPLRGDRFTSDGVRGGRQKASKTQASGLAYVAQVDRLFGDMGYAGASVYRGGLSGVTADATQLVWDVHANLKYKGVELKALHAQLSISGAADLNAELGSTIGDSVAKKMEGSLIEIGYNVLRGRSENQSLSPFIRYEIYDTQREVVSGYAADKSKDRSNLIVGINYKPLPNIVFKGDYTIGKNQAKTGYNAWNLGVGWNF